MIPENYLIAVKQYEDRWFDYHPGFNPVSLARAFWLNMKMHRIVSGGSTLTMQVARMSGKGRPRTLFRKIREILIALRLEWVYSKPEIFGMYAANAPFGGNVVGLEAASWRYFGKEPRELTWAEAATLAVLPNAPSMIHPGKRRQELLNRRNRLLLRLSARGYLDRESALLACAEPLAAKPLPLPELAPWLLDLAVRKHPGQRVATTLDRSLQERTLRIVEAAQAQLTLNQIWNVAALVAEVATGEVLAYVGNAPGLTDPDKGGSVDVIRAPRSTGSILKPLLFQAMMEEGSLLAGTLVADIPMQAGGFSPKNYLMSYDGAVPAKRALERSLNIPAVKMLQEYGVERFWRRLRRLGMTTLRFSSGHYGLSLILGGAEGNLWDLCGIYAAMARTLTRSGAGGKAVTLPAPLRWEMGVETRSAAGREPITLDKASVYITLESLTEVNRPDEESGWKAYASAGKIAWKTGTSFGFRDGWAIGTNPAWVVGVWTGNASGMGRPGLTGSGCATPVMFSIFSMLGYTRWFGAPLRDMVWVPVCRLSGHRAGIFCEPVDTVWIQKAGLKSSVCPYHRLVSLDTSGQYRVNSECMSVNLIRSEKWFILPPAQEWYYRIKNPFYKPLPPWMPGCSDPGDIRIMELVYPRNASRIMIPLELDGSPGRLLFEIAHRNPGALLYWHLDQNYLGATRHRHQFSLNPRPGKHILTVIDGEGNRFVKTFEVVGSNPDSRSGDK
jgi:penicillin-binding protein 1C